MAATSWERVPPEIGHQPVLKHTFYEENLTWQNPAWICHFLDLERLHSPFWFRIWNLDGHPPRPCAWDPVAILSNYPNLVFGGRVPLNSTLGFITRARNK